MKTKLIILWWIACGVGCGGQEAATRPTSYPASPTSEAISSDDANQPAPDSQSLPAVP